MKRRMSLPLRERAWFFAAYKHQGQLYPGTELPYLVHIGMVLLELTQALQAEDSSALDADLAIGCALLHDTVEDTETTLDELRLYFNDEIAAGVEALTKNPHLSKAASMSDSLQRLLQQPREVQMVKLSDRIANLGVPPVYWSEEKCLAYAAEGQQILAALEAASSFLAGRLGERIAAWQSMAF